MANVMSDSEIMGVVGKTASKIDPSSANETVYVEDTGSNVEATDTAQDISSQTRRLLIIGCGDGGCNIASEIYKMIPNDSFVIAYNTSNRNMDNISASIKIIPRKEDGAGKVREYSKNVFRDYAYKQLMKYTQKTLAEHPDVAYIVVCTTADGGTGSGISPMLAKLLSDNVDCPVILCGVYPSMNEDATAQYNALQWQDEAARVGVPYFIYDNNSASGSKQEAHDAVNAEVATTMSLVAGAEFGNTGISMIDSRNLYMLMAKTGGRLVGAVRDERPTANQTLDSYIEEMLHTCHQPLPSDVRGIGVFVRGPVSMLNKMDTSVPELQKKYGNAVLHFAHIEESEEIKIAILMTGCSEASDRLKEMKSRYDDIMSAQKSAASVLGDVLGDMSNPLGDVGSFSKRKPATDEPREVDLSALEM